jgi:hypothetical protein
VQRHSDAEAADLLWAAVFGAIGSSTMCTRMQGAGQGVRACVPWQCGYILGYTLGKHQAIL